jgi:exodeoxyribonuclease-3
MRTIKALSWNVNGIRAVYKKGFLEWLAHAGPDILCLQETKASEEQLSADLTGIAGYHAYFSSAVRKGYSGVALYTKTEPEQVAKGFGIEEFDSEGRTLVADYGRFVLCNVYFPNGKASIERLRYKMEFYAAFMEFIDSLQDEGKNVVICGDVNTAHQEIDIARPKENAKISGFLPQERAWMDELLNHGYVDTFRMFNDQAGQYTWWDLMTRARDRNVGWRIDYFLVSGGFADQVQAAYILPDVMGSDHCPIGIDIALPE